MKIAVTNLCRGEGKLFFHVDIDEIQADMLVAFHALTRAGQDVPVMAFVGGTPCGMGAYSAGRSFDVALPLLQDDIHFTCLAISSDGTFSQEQTETLNALGVKWRGRLNTLARRGGIDELRNCDKDRTLDRVVFEFWDYLAPESADGLLRGTAYVPCGVSAQPPQLAVFDADMNRVNVKVICSPPRKVASSKNMSAPLWELPFSAAIPANQAYAVLAALDAKGVFLPGFQTVEQWQIQQLAQAVSFVYGNAQWDSGYDSWFCEHRTGASALELQRAASSPQGPTFSIVVPLFRTPLDLFWEMLESVKAQTYPRWELVLVDASPDDAGLAKAVRAAAEDDTRVKAVFLAENGGITLNTNAGVERATGDFICYFDHDDVLEPDILYEYACAIAADESIDLLYCDEDKLLPDGTYVQPFFKPDFSIDLLRSNNYVCHMLCIRATLLRSLPVQTAKYDGAQDHNLTLLASEKARCIHHVPKVLYHWRMAEGSTAASEGNKSYAWDAGKRAVKAHLDRLGINAQVKEGILPFTCRVDYIPCGQPLVSVVIPNKDHADILDRCLSSIFEKTTYGRYEIVIVENNSQDPQTFAYYERAQSTWDRVRVVTWQGEGFNYSEIVNFGVAEACGDYLLLLNNDIEVITPEWIDLLLGACQRDDVGAVGAKLYYADDTVQHAGVGITGETAEHMGLFLSREDQGYFGLMGLMRNVSCVTAACMMTKRDVYEQVGGLDAELAVAYNDVDYCLKVRDAGKLIVMNPFVELYHYESVSRGRDDVSLQKKKRIRRETTLLWQRWSDLYVTGDPYLNPNLDTRIPFARYYRLKW